MKHLILLPLFLTACDLQELLWPADEHLAMPEGREMRLHCLAPCPPHDEIRVVMDELAERMSPHINKSPYRIWEQYSITFSDGVVYDCQIFTGVVGCTEGNQIHGLTDHQRDGIWIYTGDEYNGIRPGVLDWELRLPLVESMIPGSNEAQKIEWLGDRGLL